MSDDGQFVVNSWSVVVRWLIGLSIKKNRERERASVCISGGGGGGVTGCEQQHSGNYFLAERDISILLLHTYSTIPPL